MENKVFRFYEVFKGHQFTEREMEDIVEESKELATKGDIKDLAEALRGDLRDFKDSINKQFDSIDNKLERIDNRTDKLYDKFHQIIIWVVSTGIGVAGLVVVAIKLP